MPSLQFKSSKGFGFIEIIVALVIIGMVAGGVYIYYQSQAENNDSGVTSQEQKALVEECKVEIDDELLCQAFTVWGSIASVPYTMTMSAGTDEADIVYKVDGDNYHSVMRYEDRTLEAMKVGQTSYSKVGGIWYIDDEPEEDSSSFSEGVDKFFDKEMADRTEYKKLGQEACGDATCTKYEIATADDPEGKALMWIDEKKARLMKMQVTDTDGSKMIMEYEYGPVTITPPAEAKPMSEMMGF